MNPSLPPSASPSRVAVLSYSMTQASAASQAAWLARRCDLTILQPARWPWYAAERPVSIEGTRVVQLPLFNSGSHHFHVYRGLGGALRAAAPDLFYYDQEPWSLSTAQAVRAATRIPCAIVGFTWQNLLKRYAPPFGALERWVHRRTTMIVAGNGEAADVLRRRGYRGLVRVIPQVGVDPDAYSAARSAPRLPADGLLIGYIGRLVPEKGLETAVRAVALVPEARLAVAGVGAFERRLRDLAGELSVADRVHFLGGFASDRAPEVLGRFDALILPSRTTRRWKEQFGRVLIEAMAAGVPVIGSNSGEIPNVIGDAGIVFREGDVSDCAAAMRRVLDPARRRKLAARGHARVREHYTQERIAERCWEAWCEAYAQWQGGRRM